MNKIILITIEGCEGCKIMNNVINKALSFLAIPIKFDKLDYTSLSKDFIDTYDITDFPTTLFIKDDVLKAKIVGTANVKTVSDNGVFLFS